MFDFSGTREIFSDWVGGKIVMATF